MQSYKGQFTANLLKQEGKTTLSKARQGTVRSITSKDTNCKYEILNAKERQRDNRVFPVVSVVWQLPLIHVVALKSPR
jgi:hypothetical protein